MSAVLGETLVHVDSSSRQKYSMMISLGSLSAQIVGSMPSEIIMDSGINASTAQFRHQKPWLMCDHCIDAKLGHSVPHLGRHQSAGQPLFLPPWRLSRCPGFANRHGIPWVGKHPSWHALSECIVFFVHVDGVSMGCWVYIMIVFVENVIMDGSHLSDRLMTPN